MEILYQETIDLEHVANLCDIGLTREPLVPRDLSAWHVTDLLKSGQLIAKGENRYHRFTEEPSGIMSLGRIWETVMDHYLYDFAARQGGHYIPDLVCCRDGVAGSLDGFLNLPIFGDAVAECKLRFSASEDIPLAHLQQVRAYCRLVGVNVVCYVTGHITSRPPTVRALLRIFSLSAQSIAECWQGILNTKRYLESLGIDPAKD